MKKARQKKESNVEQVQPSPKNELMHETLLYNQEECEDHESCRQLLSTLGDYVDGTLSGELCARLEHHMKDCRRCRIVVNTMKKTIELYQETGEETPLPDDVHERLFLRLDLEDFLK
jgi:hypothetical protein